MVMVNQPEKVPLTSLNNIPPHAPIRQLPTAHAPWPGFGNFIEKPQAQIKACIFIWILLTRVFHDFIIISNHATPRSMARKPNKKKTRCCTLAFHHNVGQEQTWDTTHIPRPNLNCHGGHSHGPRKTQQNAFENVALIECRFGIYFHPFSTFVTDT